MFVAILMGFVYQQDQIGCVALDLYRVYRFCRKRRAMCFVLTDIQGPSAEVSAALANGEIDAGIVKFQPSYSGPDPLPGLRFLPVSGLQELAETLSSLELTEEPRLLFYYSGHGSLQGHMRLPSGQEVEFYQVRDAILKCCWSETQAVFIVDCCGSGSWRLPYRLDLHSKKFRLHSLESFPVQPLVMISSAQEGQLAMAHSKGSFFTKHLLEVLEEQVFDLAALLRKTAHRVDQELSYNGVSETPTAEAFASYPLLAVLWSWVIFEDVHLEANPFSLCVTVEQV